jgi:hypothetical protein
MFDFLRRFAHKTVPKKREKGSGTMGHPPQERPPVHEKSSPISVYLGRITHYYPKIQVGIVKVEKARLSLGDLIYVQGKKNRFKQRVGSIEFNHRKVKSVGPGYEIGVQFGRSVREGDEVYIVQGFA